MKRLSERLGLSYKTVAKWRHRDFVHDMPMGPKGPHSTELIRKEAICVAFCKRSLLPLDDSQFQLRDRLQAFVDAYNFAKKPKATKGLTPWKFIIRKWKSNQKLKFNIGPSC